jgi:C4-dicarboxylate-specific signal transduction histidine kinase
MTDRASDEAWLEAVNCLATVAHQLSSAAHEANNLLQVIAGSAEMIQMSPADQAKVAQRAATIAEHAHRVSTLLGSVRELGKFAPARPGEQTEVVSVVKSALDVRRHALTRARVAVTLSHDDPAPVARVSWRPAMQLVLNLILNAEQAVRERDGAAIHIQVRRRGTDVLVSVADNGIGIPEEVLSGDASHSFMPPITNEGMPPTTKEGMAPTIKDGMPRPMQDGPPLLGIGLIAARSIAARSGGTIEIERGEPGTVARLTLSGI